MYTYKNLQMNNEQMNCHFVHFVCTIKVHGKCYNPPVSARHNI